MTGSAVSAPLAPAGALLGITQYNPSSVVQYGATASFADIDATNLAISFVAPPSGSVLVEAIISTLVGANGISLNLRTGSTDIVGSEQAVNDQQGSVYVRSPYAFLQTGLTPGTSYTYKLGLVGNTTIANAVRVGGRGTTQIAGPAIITARDAATNPTVILNGITVTGTPSAGQVPVASSSTAAAWAPPVRFKTIRRATTDIVTHSSSSSTWTNLDTGLDITLNAAVGDVIEYGINGVLNNESPDWFTDVVTVVSGSPVNSFGNNGAAGTPPNYGVPGWRGSGGSQAAIGPPALYTLVSGDISAGTVTLRLRFITSTTTDRTLFAGGNFDLIVYAKNLGAVAT